MFVNDGEDGTRVILIVYVGDILITNDDKVDIDKLKKKELIEEYEVNDLGFLRNFIGVEIASKDGNFIP